MTLAWLYGAVDPVVCVLGTAALAGVLAHGAGDASVVAALAVRLLLALLYIAAGAHEPSPVGVVVVTIGLGLAVLAGIAARRSARVDTLRAILSITVQTPDGSRGAVLGVPGGASTNYAARRAAFMLGLAAEMRGGSLLKHAMALPSGCSLRASGVRSGDVLRLAVAARDERGNRRAVQPFGRGGQMSRARAHDQYLI